MNSIEKIQKAEVEYCKDNAEYFIENYVHIEDRDSVDIAVLFKLWDGQKQALQGFINNRLNIVLKARQLGLSWLSLAYAVYCVLFNAGYQVVALSKREEDAKELVRRVIFILRYMPDWLCREDSKENEDWQGIKWTATSMSVRITHAGKENSVFNSMSASADSGRSFTANLVILDEWAFQQFAREIWASAYPTINRPTGGKVIGLSTAKRLTLFEEIWRKSCNGLNTFHRIFLSWRTDPRRDDAWYEQTKKDLGELTTMQEYPNTPEEAFTASEGSAFPEFSESIHVCEPFEIPSHWRKWRAVDNGYTDPFAWYWYAVNERGTVFIYREYTRDEKEEKVIYTDQARNVVKLTKESNVNINIAGHDAWNTHHRDSANKSLIDYYQDGGLKAFVKAVTDRKIRKSTWHEYLKPYVDENIGVTTAKVQIFSTCRKLIETLPQLLCDEKDNEKVAECSIDHWYDGAGYGLIYHHSDKSAGEQQNSKFAPDTWEYKAEKNLEKVINRHKKKKGWEF